MQRRVARGAKKERAHDAVRVIAKRGIGAKAQLVLVEIDGSQHADSGYDRERAEALKARGFRVLRFWNDEVMRELDPVCDTIIAFVRDTSLQPWR